MEAERAVRVRRIRQWLLAPVVVAVIGLGWKYPALGFVVPVVMVTGLVGSFFAGRYVCGNWCPRGGFLDRIVAPWSRRTAIPAWVRRPAFRWAVLVVLMGFMGVRLAANPTDPMHWGRVFWMMCLVTTGIGFVLGFLIHPRMWCAFCPIGFVQNLVGGGRGRLRIDAARCRGCRLCETACPFDLEIVAHKGAGFLPDRDCLRCSECVAVCPHHALSWPSRRDAA